MIVTTINVNGVRAAVRERSTDNLGLLAWLAETAADVVCVQVSRGDDTHQTEAVAPEQEHGSHLAAAEPNMSG